MFNDKKKDQLRMFTITHWNEKSGSSKRTTFDKKGATEPPMTTLPVGALIPHLLSEKITNITFRTNPV